ncbi:MAG: CotH kinase family protein [Saprospiraceae bacterium]|nr:CotH kinase family protein [Saprospiraceae bacterium]
MILKQTRKQKYPPSFYLWFIPLIVIGMVYAYFPDQTDDALPFSTAPLGDVKVFETDLETFEGNLFLADSHQFEGANLRSTQFVHSGQYSIELDRDNIYGLTTWFIPPTKEATYHASIYRYNPDGLIAPLVIAGSNSDELYITEQEGHFESTDSVWEVIHATFQVPPDIDSLKLYCLVSSQTAGKVYFDDFTLSISDLELISAVPLPILDLEIGDDGLRKLKQKRLSAWNDGILVSAEDDWVKARLRYDDQEKKAKIRLKGDWLDHLRGNNWSFRVNLKDPESLWGMVEFNLQKPDTRGLMNEWIYHKLLAEHDILSPKYEFIILRINGESRGIYACEEHFHKELVESQNRREGPILKFSEARMWNGVKRQFDDLGNGQYVLENDKEQSYHSAPIEAFDDKVVQGNPDLRKVYERGFELMNEYRRGSIDLGRIFDVERVGKYLAIIDLLRAYHSLTWHNQRWYYNPLSDRLEPIGFDGFTTDEPKLSPGFTLAAEEAYKGKYDKYEPYKQLYQNPQIAAVYIRYLDSLSTRSYLTSFFESIDSSLVSNAVALQEEYKIETFQRHRYIDHASRIRLTVPAYPESIECSHSGPDKLYIINHHVLPIKVYGRKKKSIVIFPSEYLYSGKEFPWHRSASEVQFSVLGLDSLYSSPILPFSNDLTFTNREETDSLHPLLIFQDSTSYVLLSGRTSKSIVVPEGKTLLVPEGTNLVLNENAYLLVQGAIKIGGKKENPVIIESDDGTGAVVVRGAIEKSYMTNVTFRHLGRVNKDGYLLTGGVTIFESPITLDQCVFRDNTAEDALNIVRSRFEMTECVFENTAFDAFDSDFSEGTLRHCNFVNAGNDAIDFSGSECSVSDCTLKMIGDKGISVGENSKVKVHSLMINDANIGLASKDLSILEVDYVSFERVNTCFTAYQKKATFGPAKIYVKDYETKRIGRIHLIEQGSILDLPETGNTSD